MPGYRECLSPHHQDGSSTKGNEGDNLHQTLSNRVTTASKQQERHTPGTSHLICQYSNRQHEGYLSRPPSINDEETLLQRRQRTTLSQLCSGHCKLLNSYKNRLKQSDSSRCPDCGMDPQDVPHLFDCVAHPNDLSPVNLWDKPIETIRELSFLDPGNLN